MSHFSLLDPELDGYFELPASYDAEMDYDRTFEVAPLPLHSARSRHRRSSVGGPCDSAGSQAERCTSGNDGARLPFEDLSVDFGNVTEVPRIIDTGAINPETGLASSTMDHSHTCSPGYALREPCRTPIPAGPAQLCWMPAFPDADKRNRDDDRTTLPSKPTLQFQDISNCSQVTAGQALIGHGTTPLEILEEVMQLSDPREIVRLASTCKSMRARSRGIVKASALQESFNRTVCPLYRWSIVQRGPQQYAFRLDDRVGT